VSSALFVRCPREGKRTILRPLTIVALFLSINSKSKDSRAKMDKSSQKTDF
jgi:hypothetical protein